MKALFFAFVAISLSACTTTPLTPEENAVKVLQTPDAPAGCKKVGEVGASTLISFTDSRRESYLKYETYKLGGNTVTKNQKENGTIYGTAYNCPN